MLGWPNALVAWALWSPASPVEPIAHPAAYALDWSAPEGCPTAEAIEARVTALVGEPDGGEGTMLVEGRVTATDGTYALTLRTRFAGHEDSRSMEATRCGALGESAALVVAIALDPSFDPTAPTAPTAEAPEGPLVPKPMRHERSERATATVVRPTEHTEQRDRPEPEPEIESTSADEAPAITAWVAPGVEYGALPGAAVHTELGAGALWRRAAVELAGAYTWPQRGRDGLYQQGAVAAHGCARLWAGAVEFPLCLGVAGGALRIDSRGLREQRVAHGPWAGPSARVAVRVATPRVWLRLAGDVVVPIVRARVLVGEDAVFEARPASARLTAAVGFFFTIDPAHHGHR